MTNTKDVASGDPTQSPSDSVLNELLKFKDLSSSLHFKILEHAADLKDKAVFKQLRTGTYSWLSSGLSKVYASSTMSD